MLTAAIMVIISTPAWSIQRPATIRPLSINQLAAKPDSFVGKVTVVGRIVAVAPGKGFTLIDSTNCANCLTECLLDKSTKKIPFLWTGSAQVVKDVVRVDGVLAKTASGYTFTAERVTKQ